MFVLMHVNYEDKEARWPSAVFTTVDLAQAYAQDVVNSDRTDDELDAIELTWTEPTETHGMYEQSSQIPVEDKYLDVEFWEIHSITLDPVA